MHINDLSILDEKHICPDCSVRMTPCEAPPVHVGDGLGWGSEVLFICLNNECPPYKSGWKTVDVNYGHKGTFRNMQLPGSTEQNVMMVASEVAFTGSIIDRQQILEQNTRYQNEKKATEALDTCLEKKDIEPVMILILDEAATPAARQRAIEMLFFFNDLSCIDPIRNHTFKQTSFKQMTDMVIQKLLEKNNKKECPFCAELVKAHAKKCIHCKSDF